MTVENNLLRFMSCEPLDLNLFRGQSKDMKTGQVYGGQVLGQAIKAAQGTVSKDLHIHSAHAYFLRRGDVNAPIIYEVDRSRDGSSFSSRRVVAIQHGRQIFHLSASFQVKESGLDFYNKIEPPIKPLQMAIESDNLDEGGSQSEYLEIYRLSSVQKTTENTFQMWVKTRQPLPQGQDAHCAVLAYISDMGLLLSAFLAHDSAAIEWSQTMPNFVVASLDHAIWYHRPFRADEWFFYDCRAESTGNSRGFSHGRVYTADGTLVASTSQEGLIRIKAD